MFHEVSDSVGLSMAFIEQEKNMLLAVKGVGPTVVQRLEEIGIHSLVALSEYEVNDIVEMVAGMLHSTCWKNSPQAKQAIASAIICAKNNR